MGFHEVPWNFMRFYDVLVNRSVPTEANRGLTSYTSLSWPAVWLDLAVASRSSRLTLSLCRSVWRPRLHSRGAKGLAHHNVDNIILAYA
jgi:hypothetical protein